MFDLYLITDTEAPERIAELVSVALQALDGERVAVQLRAKTLDERSLFELASGLRKSTRAAGCRLLINSDLELARQVGADGVHLPETGPSVEAARQLLGPATMIGCSCHDEGGLISASRSGASFATLSPLFVVPAKAAALGLARFRDLAGATELPVFALGGITATRVGDAMAHGARGVAVVREVFGSADPSLAVQRLLMALDASNA